MTKSEMKKIMKPIVKECIKEMLLEEGLLSNLVSEVIKGQQGSVVAESKTEPRKQMFPSPVKQQRPAQINEVRKKLADSIGNGAYADIFEGLQPAPSPGESGESDGDAGMDLSMLNNIPGLQGFKTRKNG